MQLQYGQLYTFKGKMGDDNQYQCITYKNFDLYIPNYQITMYNFNINIYIKLIFSIKQYYNFNKLFNGFVYVKVDTPDNGPVTAISFHRGSGSLRHPYEGQV